MEAQQTNASISQFSRMNAFYGIPNVSQESTTAVERGARAPEVYAPETPELPEPRAAGTGTNPAIPVESFFSQTTEQLEISDQAVALQQQQENEAPAAQATYGATDGSTPRETQAPSQESGIEAQLQTEEGPRNVGQEVEQTPEPGRPLQATNSQPAAASALNEGPTPEPETTGADNNQQPANNPLQQSYGQFPGGGPAASNASQPGALFNALG